jgi:hypothetical protein
MNSKSKRKFRFWDNNALFQVFEQVTQIKGLIESKCTDRIGPESLPMSVIPTDVLYDIAACYEAMYEKLLEEELLVAGYPKSTNTYQ